MTIAFRGRRGGRAAEQPAAPPSIFDDALRGGELPPSIAPPPVAPAALARARPLPSTPPREASRPRTAGRAMARRGGGGGGGGSGGGRRGADPGASGAAGGGMRPAAAVLFRFLRGVGSGLKSSSLGPELRGENVLVDGMSKWTYQLRQGAEEQGLRAIGEAMAPRLYRSGGRLLGPAWAPLLLGGDFAYAAPKRQEHTLEYLLTDCSCLRCLAADAAEEQDCPSVDSLGGGGAQFGVPPDEAGARRGGPHDVPARPAGPDGRPPALPPALRPATHADGVSALLRHSAASGPTRPLLPPHRNSHFDRLAQGQTGGGLGRSDSGVPEDDEGALCALPSAQTVSLLGGVVQPAAQFEIGVVSKLNSRGGARLTLSEEMKRFAEHAAYTGPSTVAVMYSSVLRFAQAYYHRNKGKRERKVFVRGELQHLPVPTCVLSVGQAPLNMHEPAAIAVLARAQELSLFTGGLVLEGSFGSYIDMSMPWYVGFGEAASSQAVFSGGSLGPPRPLGINELCVHSDAYETAPRRLRLS